MSYSEASLVRQGPAWGNLVPTVISIGLVDDRLDLAARKLACPDTLGLLNTVSAQQENLRVR